MKNLGANESGFAMNEAFAGKFKDDGGKPGDLLIYVSPEDRAWNAIGKPKKGARGITLEGKLAEAP